ncbi:MAG TPA: peptidoglycan DD-metalloendopeptidase family protein, partial [Candidatus Baltobacteraceae bacterium]|nr:peptidoglycan DD-metalloendopeptidase family protein [Candidatus Baltobacteraceae bacterium]
MISRPIVWACWLLASVIAILVTRRGTWQNRTVFIGIFAAVGVGFAGGSIATMGFALIAAIDVVVTLWSLIDRRFDARRWWNRAADPIVLESPFADAWYVAAGGPEPRHNHHQVASDQYFAYDFLPEEGEAWDREILAPCDGTVAWTEDRHDDAPPGERRRDRRNPAGNYVSIETKRGFVLLGHLKRGSIAVRVADTVRAGMPIARCGNSGNTSQSHLHLHAQDR